MKTRAKNLSSFLGLISDTEKLCTCQPEDPPIGLDKGSLNITLLPLMTFYVFSASMCFVCLLVYLLAGRRNKLWTDWY